MVAVFGPPVTVPTPPRCACGCRNRVSRSAKNPKRWNRYYSRHGSSSRSREQLERPPHCACSCGRSVVWNGRGWRRYADHPIGGPYLTLEQTAARIKRADGTARGVSARTLERYVARGLAPRPVLVKVRGKLRPLFLISELRKRRIL